MHYSSLSSFWHMRYMVPIICIPQFWLLALRPPCTHMHAENKGPYSEKQLKMEFNESTGQNEVLRHFAWLDNCIDQQPDKRHLDPFISLSLYFLIPAPSQTTQIFPFPCLWFLLSSSDNSLVQWQNVPLCIPHWVSYLYRQFPHSAFKVDWRPSTVNWWGWVSLIAHGADTLLGCPGRSQVERLIPLPELFGLSGLLLCLWASSNAWRWAFL